MKYLRKTVALISVLMLSLVLVACGTSNGGSAAPSNDGTSSTTEATEATKDELFGHPWVTSILSGNLPPEQPEVKDDLYAHYNYEYLSAHQGGENSAFDDYATEMQDAVTAIIKDKSKTGHDLEQLRILYDQAADSEALRATGLSEVQPYLDRIDAVTTLDEMNALLVAEDFPFSPFIVAFVSPNDTRGLSIVNVMPNFVLTDSLLEGSTYYQQSDDAQTQEYMQAVLQVLSKLPAADFADAGLADDEVQAAIDMLLTFEKAHGQHLDAMSTYMNADYGHLAEVLADSYVTPDEMLALSPAFPLKETLDKMGKGDSKTYAVERDWLEAFDALWVEDNLDAIKLVAKAKILGETRPYRDPSATNALLEQVGQPVPDDDTFAFIACTSLDTLSNVVAKTYVEDVLGPNCKSRIEALSQDLVNTYKDLVANTAWVGGKSKKRVIEKLDNMTLNVLEPAGGYFDYSELNLTPTNEGGTLFSNYLKLKQYRYDCESKLVNRPSSRGEMWCAVAPTINNAFYDPGSNSINILPGYISSLIYTDEMTDADLLASIGWTVGHEISHSFDYTGSQVDAYGRPKPVFSDADVDAFVLKCSALALYYNKIEVVPSQMVDGQLVVGEAAADLCGMQACLELASKIDGFDFNNYFKYVSCEWAQVTTEDYLPILMLDTHPLNHLRVNVNAQMYDAIYDELGVAEGDGMYLAPEERIAIWGPNA